MPCLIITCKCSMMNFWEKQQKLMWTSANNKLSENYLSCDYRPKSNDLVTQTVLMPTM